MKTLLFKAIFTYDFPRKEDKSFMHTLHWSKKYDSIHYHDSLIETVCETGYLMRIAPDPDPTGKLL